MTTLVNYTVADGVGRLRLSRPNAGNAVSPPLIADLTIAIAALATARPKVVLIEADGPNFCFGGDILHLAEAGASAGTVLQSMAEGFHAALIALKALRVPIIAAVRGHAVGGGLGLCLVSDLLLVSDTAKLSTGYIRLGLSADGGVSYFLTEALGQRRALAMLLDPTPVTASRAVDIGLAHRLVADQELDTYAAQLAATFTHASLEASQAMRRLVSDADGRGLNEHLVAEEREICSLAATPHAQRQLRLMMDKTARDQA